MRKVQKNTFMEKITLLGLLFQREIYLLKSKSPKKIFFSSYLKFILPVLEELHCMANCRKKVFKDQPTQNKFSEPMTKKNSLNRLNTFDRIIFVESNRALCDFVSKNIYI